MLQAAGKCPAAESVTTFFNPPDRTAIARSRLAQHTELSCPCAYLGWHYAGSQSFSRKAAGDLEHVKDVIEPEYAV